MDAARAKSLFLAASDLVDAVDRAAFLDQECGGDAALRAPRTGGPSTPFTEAEPLLVQGYEGLQARAKTIPSVAARRIPEALDRLIELYTATNNPDELKNWQAERARRLGVAG